MQNTLNKLNMKSLKANLQHMRITLFSYMCLNSP